MISIFKSLITITAWVLFVFGLLALIGGVVVSIGASNGVPGMAKPLLAWAHFGYGTVNLALAVMAIKFRRMIE